MKTGTLTELNVQVGDVVMRESSKQYADLKPWTIKRVHCGEFFGVKPNYRPEHSGCRLGADYEDWTIIERPNEPRAWGDWESAKGWEKDNDWLERIEPGCLQILMPDGEQRTINHFTDLPKGDFAAFRVKPEPVVETVTFVGNAEEGFDPAGWTTNTHRITFTTKDGEPDCDSIKMERINV